MTTKQHQRAVRSVCKDIAGRLRRRWGVGWYHLGEDLREALVAAEALSVFTGRDDGSTTTCAEIRLWQNEIRKHAGMGAGETQS